MLLSTLLSLAGFSAPAPYQDGIVKRLITDSRQCQPGDLFIGMPGTKVDGSQFALQAIERGAIGAVVERVSGLSHPQIILLPDILQACAQLSAAFYNFPAQYLKLVGITGTNGKTTTAHLIEFLVQSQYPTFLLGTLYTRWQGFVREAKLTTPFSVQLQETLRQAVDAGCQAGVMEVSSHALDQKRVWGCSFDAAVFTNLTQDHLDYHQDMESYFQAKALLFQENYLQGMAIINWDDPFGKRLLEIAPHKLTYSLTDPCADFFTTQLVFQPHGVTGDLHTPYGIMPLRSSLVGSFNVMNVMAAVATALYIGIPLATITDRLPSFQPVPGRLERVSLGPNQDITVVVDYAHTPDSLENILRAMRPFTKRELICVFGCGGDRDRTKRPIMGEIACRLSDWVYVTSDNPRTENPEQILEEILQGISQKNSVVVEIDRRKAIEEAILHAYGGDTVVIAGKGHEDYQIIGTQKIHFDDREEARAALQKRQAVLPSHSQY